MKLGRNDPCWCGSEKKYKKCHQSADEAKARAESQIRTLTEWVTHYGRVLTERVKTAAGALDGFDAISAAFYGESTPADPLADAALLQIAAFDHPASAPIITGAPIADDDNDMTTLATTLAGSFLSLLEVTESKPGKGVRIIDRLTGHERFLWEADLCAVLDPLEVITGRVIVINKKAVLVDGWEKLYFRGRKAAIADVTAWITETDVAEDDAVGKAGWLKRNAARVVARARAAQPQ